MKTARIAVACLSIVATAIGCSLSGLSGGGEETPAPAEAGDASPIVPDAPTTTVLPDGATVACGALGDACCAGDTCNAGGACTGEKKCAPCGGVGQQCCTSGESCQAALQCQGNACVKGCAARVAAGDNHACLVRTDGTLFCWGSNGSGQLGIGLADGAPHVVPTEVTTLKNVADVAGSDQNTCVVLKDGTLWCWGNNYSGSLGLGASDSNPHPAPVQVPGMTGSVESSAAYVHTCVRRTDLSIWCWGNNGAGQVGNGASGAPVPAPFRVMYAGSPLNVTALAAGNAHTCAVRTDGAAFCWGYNSVGQIGDGFSGVPPRTTPVPVVSSNVAFTKLAAGTDHTCATSTAGAVYCWGSNSSGQLGTGVAGSASSPALVAGLTTLKISAAASRTCAIRSSDKALLCWGSNNSGELGDGTTTPRSSPTPVQTIKGVKDVAVGQSHTCAVDGDDWVWCWGRNSAGQLGVDAKDAALHAKPERVKLACPP